MFYYQLEMVATWLIRGNPFKLIDLRFCGCLHGYDSLLLVLFCFSTLLLISVNF